MCIYIYVCVCKIGDCCYHSTNHRIWQWSFPTATQQSQNTLVRPKKYSVVGKTGTFRILIVCFLQLGHVPNVAERVLVLGLTVASLDVLVPKTRVALKCAKAPVHRMQEDILFRSKASTFSCHLTVVLNFEGILPKLPPTAISSAGENCYHLLLLEAPCTNICPFGLRITAWRRNFCGFTISN